ncbi:MAG: hypothetical protein MJ063_08340 [Lachnospiraceae bacterium]|nr:hypothetical protein [Lachnospiraceae bacterium]
MNWFVCALLCVAGWGLADLFYKKGTDDADRWSHLRIAAWVGLVMGAAAVVILLLQNAGILPAAASASAEAADPAGKTVPAEISRLLGNMLAYAPASIPYILSMVIGYAGLRYLELSVVSPVQNASGALSVILMAVWLTIRGKGSEIMENVSALDIAGTLFIVAATIGLAFVEQKIAESDTEPAAAENTVAAGKGPVSKYRFGALALAFPLLYCLFDALGTAADGVILSGNGSLDLTEWDVLVLYGLTFFAAGLLCWIWLWSKEGHPYRMFSAAERPKMTAAIAEECGQVFYVFAMAADPMAAAPIVASYCIVSVILSHLILKERLRAGQYACVAAFIIGILLLGISEGMAA